MITETIISGSYVYGRAHIHTISEKIVGGEVCARRARKLRKRGEQLLWQHNTVNGKARYTWMKGRFVTFSGYYE